MLRLFNNSPSFYDILNLPQEATKEEICRAYQSLRNPFSAQEQDVDSPESSNLEFAYFTLTNARQRRVYDYYGRWGLYMLDTPYATFVEPDMEKVFFQYLFQLNIVKSGIGLSLGLMAACVDGGFQLDYTITFIPLLLVGLGLLVLYSCVIHYCTHDKLVTPGYADRFLEGVPGHPQYPTKLSFIVQHVFNIIKLSLGLIFIVLVQFRLHGFLIPYTILCIPLYPFFLSSYFFFILQITLISLKLDMIALTNSSWPSVLVIIYCISGWHLVLLVWWGWKSARQDREMMQYFHLHHKAIVRTKISLWAVTVLRPWFLNTLSISLVTAYLVDTPQHQKVSFVWVVTPLLVGILQDLIITGAMLPLYLYYIRIQNIKNKKFTICSSTTPLKLPSSTSPDEDAFYFSLSKLM